MDANSILEASTGGRVGVSALTGSHRLSRFAARNVTGTLLGPSVGAGEDLLLSARALATQEISEGDVSAMRRLLHQRIACRSGRTESLSPRMR